MTVYMNHFYNNSESGTTLKCFSDKYTERHVGLTNGLHFPEKDMAAGSLEVP